MNRHEGDQQNKGSAVFGLSPDKLVSLWRLGSEESASKSQADTPSDIGVPEIEGYEVQEKVGEGGMGTVWRAVQLSTKRQVALKLMNCSAFGSKRTLARFEQEVELSARLEHPNIARVYESGLYRGFYYYTMEFIEGVPLDTYVQNRILPCKAIVELMETICGAVNHAHQRRVIHRDLKPSNILVDSEGQPYILDFGLAKAADEDDQNPSVSIDGQVLGTLAYMSPEQVSGNIRSVDMRTDVYSLGVILYKLTTSKFPYDITGTLPQVADRIFYDEPVKPSRILRHFNYELEAIILKSLQKESDQRYPSVASLQQDLQYWLKGLPVSAKNDSSLYLIRKLMVRHKYATAVVSLLIIIIIGFSYTSFDLYLSAEKDQSKANDYAKQLEQELVERMRYAQPRTFVQFLRAFHNGKLKEALFVSRFLEETSKERIAAEFLFDERPLSEKEAILRNRFSGNQSWFADFTLAENCLQKGEPERAQELYRLSLRSLMSLPDQEQATESQLIERIQSRLYSLSARESRATSESVLSDP